MRTAPTTIVCAGCNQPAKIHSYRLRNGTGKYCSQSCYLAHRWPGGRSCKQCGKSCEVRYCSQECQKAFRNKHSARLYKQPKWWAKKIALIEQLGAACGRCGFNDFRALDIDHIDPTTKLRFKTGSAQTRRFKDWEANAGNLQLLCANCHRLHTWEQQGYGRGLACSGTNK